MYACVCMYVRKYITDISLVGSRLSSSARTFFRYLSYSFALPLSLSFFLSLSLYLQYIKSIARHTC